SSGQKIESPVSVSPLMIAQFIADSPRWAGSRLGWYWIVPSLGTANTSSGRNSVTKAITHRSISMLSHRLRPSAVVSAEVDTSGSPLASPSAYSGSVFSSDGSGADTTDTVTPSESSRSSTALPNAFCTIRAIRSTGTSNDITIKAATVACPSDLVAIG